MCTGPEHGRSSRPCRAGAQGRPSHGSSPPCLHPSLAGCPSCWAAHQERRPEAQRSQAARRGGAPAWRAKRRRPAAHGAACSRHARPRRHRSSCVGASSRGRTSRTGEYGPLVCQQGGGPRRGREETLPEVPACAVPQSAMPSRCAGPRPTPGRAALPSTHPGETGSLRKPLVSGTLCAASALGAAPVGGATL
jgi:hypothetical protein